MGRAMLIVVILVTTIYARILTSVHRETNKLPAVLVDNLLRKEVENVSDYAVRNAIRNAGSMTFAEETTSSIEFTQVYNDYHVGNCTIDSIHYSFVSSSSHFLVKTYVRGELQGRTVAHTAEMGFNYPQESIGAKPNVCYLEMEKFMLFPWLIHSNKYLPDTSGNGYTASAYNILISATVPYGGAYSRMCAQFDGVDNYMTVGIDTDFAAATKIDTDASFSIVGFAKIDKSGRLFYANNQGTLIWIAADPFAASNSANARPSAGIWYSKADGKVHFAVTLDDPAKTMVEAAVPYTRYAVIYVLGLFNLWHYNYPWNSFGLTFSSGVLKAYINGALVSTAGTYASDKRARPSTYGMMLGRRDYRYNNVAYNDYKYFCGMLDQVGMYDRALTAAEMLDWHNGVLNAANILYIKD